MNRRHFILSGIVGSYATTLAGCVGNSNSESTAAVSGSRPKKVVEQFINAVDNGNADTIAAHIHSSGNLAGEADTLAERGETIEVTSIRTNMAVQENEEAFVNAEIKYQNNAEEDLTDTDLYELRKENNEWLIYGEPSQLPLKYRLEGVAPANSFETTIGLSESSAGLFFRAKDVSNVDLRGDYQENDLDIVAVSFSGAIAERIQETGADLGSDLSGAKIFEYLDGELIDTKKMSSRLARLIESGQWAANPEYILTYEDAESAERVAATILEHMEG